MRKYFVTTFVLVALLVFATSGLALEKTSMRLTDDSRADNWNAATTCTVLYYNYCTGWLWIWSGWSPGDILGVQFDAPNSGGGTLYANWLFTWTGAPSGYGFTGSLDVNAADANACPTGAAIGSQPYLPAGGGWEFASWGAGVAVPGSFTVGAVMGATAGNPTTFVTDHPAAGPTGPTPCGTCFPTSRDPHSYYWGSAASPLCPGSTLFDGVCDAGFVWEAIISCSVGVEPSSWGSVKGLYK
ncbi:MAG: hypothetical protein CME07_01695 [Gemmatimonadetes bacterium]|nr:hypothetical protein [Gemmatimonadota bacterium]